MRLLGLLALPLLASGCALVGYDLDAASDGAVTDKDGGDGNGSGGRKDRDGAVGTVGTGRPDGGGPVGTDAPDAAGNCRTFDIDGPRACPCEPKATICEGDVLVTCDEEGRIATATDCSEGVGPCEVGHCDPEEGCSVKPAPDDTACDDGLFCTTGEACKAGVCDGGDERDCGAKDSECTLGVCDEDGERCAAVPTHEGLDCNDGSLCTLEDKCDLGTCAGVSMDCSSHDGVCKVGVCKEETGTCAAKPMPDGTTCADGKICGEGTCRAGEACGLSEQCMIGCDPATSCLLQCTGAQDCEANCAGAATCTIDCSFTEACQPSCTTDSSCNVACGTSEDCDVVCDASECNIDCAPTGQCDQIECVNDAACIVTCGANPNCGFKTCWSGAPTDCGDGTFVCGRVCG